MDREIINAYLSAALAESTAENTPGFDRYMGIPNPFKGRGPELAARSTTRLLPIREAHCEAEPKEKIIPGRLAKREKRAAAMRETA